MSRRLLPRLTAAALTLSLVLPFSASALTVEQAAELLEDVYVDPIPPEVLEQETISDMLDALGDPYTNYMSPSTYESFKASMADSSITGVGLVGQQHQQGILVVTVYDDSPAQAGGLQAGDIILSADGQVLEGMDLSDSIELLRGEAGTSVQVTFLHEEQELTATLTRAKVVIPTASAQLLEDHIGYIRCTSFGPETARHFREGVKEYRDRANVWIVDLRDNTGGYINAAADAAACFTGPGVATYMRGGNGAYVGLTSAVESMTMRPVIVLTNSSSASSSELFAGSIRDRGAGIVVGQRTFGKGVIQSVYDQTVLPDYFPDGDAMKITSQRFFSPSGNTNDQLGILPNLAVDGMTQEVAMLLAGRDPAGDTTGFMRIGLDWQWSVELDYALSPEMKPALEELLSSLPWGTELALGTGGPDGWEAVTPEEAAQRLGLTLDSRAFPDVADSGYADAIQLLATHQLVGGDENGLFHPSSSLTRAELCQLIAVTLGCFIPNQPSPFVDVAEDAWYKDAVTSLAKMGLVNGVGGDRFDPEGTVDHQQFFTLMARLASWLNMSFHNAAETMPRDALHNDIYNDYAPWARSGVWLLAFSQQGLLGNTVSMLWDAPEAIDPQAPTLREEAAFLLCRLLVHTETLPR